MDPKHLGTFYGLNIDDWIQTNLSNLFDTGGDITWCQIWSVAFWKIWGWRNEDVHNADFRRPFMPAAIVRHNLLDYEKGKNVLNFDAPYLPRKDV